MFKTTFYIFMITCMLFSVYFLNTTPIFGEYGNNYEVYTENYSSSADIVPVNAIEYAGVFGKKGESCEIKTGITPEEVFNRFNAKILFVENTVDGVNYYGYSPRIKYKTIIKGRLINLHVCVGKAQTKIGSPIIFGSF